MVMLMDITLNVGTILSMQQAKGSFKESLDVNLEGMTDAELQDYMCPTNADYAHIPVRMLTATGVQGNTINFGHLDGKALKEAVDLFNGLTILKDHNFTVDAWLGKTEGAFWDTLTAGAPAGITGIMKVDKKADPKTCRGLISGALDSVSVTIGFEYEKSHPKMSDGDFFMHMGEVVDGVVVQALVTKVSRVYELSVVWQGADKFAKTIGDDGNINTPGVNSNSQTFSQPTKEVTVDPKKLAALLGLNLGDSPTEEAVTTALKAQLQSVTELQTKLTTAETAKTEALAQVTKMTVDLATATASVNTLNSKVETLSIQAKIGETTLTTARTEALRLYNLVEDKKATEVMRTLISNADLSVAQSFIDTYKDRAEQIAPLQCTKCGCTELSRQQAEQPPTDDHKKQVDTAETARLKSATSSIHG